MGVLPHGTRFGAMDSPTAVGGTAEVSPSLTATLRTSVNLFNVRIRSFPGLAVTKSLMTMSTSPSLMGLRAQAVHLVLFASRASWVAPGALVSVTPTSTTSTDTVCRGLLDDDALQPVSETTTTAATSRQHIRADPTLRGSKGNLSRATVSRSVARHRHHPLVCRRSGRAAARRIRQTRGMNDDELAGHDDLSAHRERLKILDAMARAIDRRAELYEILDSATSAEDASTMLMRTFDVDVIQATSILDLQLRRLPRQESSQIGAERDEIRKRLGLD
jgi:hypothetical protein